MTSADYEAAEAKAEADIKAIEKSNPKIARAIRSTLAVSDVLAIEADDNGGTTTPPVEPPIEPPVIEPVPPQPPQGSVANPAPTTSGLSIQSDTTVDHEWKKSFASFWCDHKARFIQKRLVIDGRLIKPNPNQVEPKIFGATDYVFDGLVVRNIASCKRGDAGSATDDDVHTEGLYLGAAINGIIKNSYWGFTDGNTAVAWFTTWFPGSSNVPVSKLLIHNCRIDLGGVNGDGKTYWGGPIWYTFQGKAIEVVMRNVQVRRGASGGEAHFGNGGATSWPASSGFGGSGYWEYAGSRSGGNSGRGFQWVEKGEEWPDFPDGDGTLPKSLCVKGY
jgi:hypothetical protein